jgi:hypothetical protein
MCLRLLKFNQIPINIAAGFKEGFVLAAVGVI